MSQKVIELLNEARTRELTAITQYMAQHYELDAQGFGKVGSKIKEIAITEMKHAEQLAERILFLGGAPIYKPSASPKKGEEIPTLIKTDIGLETEAIEMYNDAASVCGAEKDQVSRHLFEELLGDEEGHLNYFQTTLAHVEKLGEAYLSTLAD